MFGMRCHSLWRVGVILRQPRFSPCKSYSRPSLSSVSDSNDLVTCSSSSSSHYRWRGLALASAVAAGCLTSLAAKYVLERNTSVKKYQESDYSEGPLVLKLLSPVSQSASMYSGTTMGRGEAMKAIRDGAESLKGNPAHAWPNVITDPEGLTVRFKFAAPRDMADFLNAALHWFSDNDDTDEVSSEFKMELTGERLSKKWSCLSLRNDSISVAFCYTSGGAVEVMFDKRDAKNKDWSMQEVRGILSLYEMGNRAVEESVSELTSLGLKIYSADEKLTFDALAGYEDVKEQIHNSVVLALQHPEVFDSITKGTRVLPASNRPKAILFEGEPGTGKTTAARIIASSISVPLIYLPVETIMSKYYGQSEKILSQIFDECEKLGEAIIFIDEIDSLATRRGSEMHEATRRILSVLLRRIEGFESGTNGSLVIGATNRRDDLDEALLSRFDVSIKFPLPNAKERAAIYATYAKHLPSSSLNILADQSEGFAGRNIRDVCAAAERNFAAKILENQSRGLTLSSWGNFQNNSLPALDDYLTALNRRKLSFQ